MSTADSVLGSDGASKVEEFANGVMGVRLGGVADNGDVPHDRAEMTS